MELLDFTQVSYLNTLEIPSHMKNLNKYFFQLSLMSNLPYGTGTHNDLNDNGFSHKKKYWKDFLVPVIKIYSFINTLLYWYYH